MSEYKTVHLRYDKYMEMKEKADSIVRCGECIYWRERDGMRYCANCFLTDLTADDFCSRGKRR